MVQNIFVREKLTFILLGLNYKGLKVTGKYGLTLLQLSGKTLGTVIKPCTVLCSTCLQQMMFI